MVLHLDAAIQIRTCNIGLTALVRVLKVGVHYPASCRDCVIEHDLHHLPLVGANGESDAIALPVASRPRRFPRHDDTGDRCQGLAITSSQFATKPDYFG